MPSETQDLQGKRMLVTGSAGGLGLETVKALLDRGASVILSARSEARARPALEDLRSRHPAARLDFVAIDLADLASVERAAAELLRAGQPLDVLINNAGVAAIRGLTRDGFELTFGTNHLGPFLLTERLRPLLVAAPQGRVVNVSSETHLHVKQIDWSAFRREHPFVLTRLKLYAVSKLLNVLHAKELARRLAGTRVTTYAVHPGAVATDIWREAPRLLQPLMKRFMLGGEAGARTQLWCATAPELSTVSGRYYERCHEVPANPLADDPELGRKLWEFSEAAIAEALGRAPARV